MLEVYGNLWEQPADMVVITTNGFLKLNGALVMGRGCAREARDSFPGLDLELGAWVRQHGNVPGIFEPRDRLGIPHLLATLPVKHHFRDMADMALIRKSVSILINLVHHHPRFWNNQVRRIVMPRPGCGNGGLPWYRVRPMLRRLLDDRFVVVSWAPTAKEARDG